MARRPTPSRSPFAHLQKANHAEEPEAPFSEEGDSAQQDEHPDTSSSESDNTPPSQDDHSSDDEPLSEEEMDAEDERDDKDDLTAEDEDEPEDTEIRNDAKARAAARCRAIFRRPEAGHNIALACHLAFNTSMNRRQAVAALRAASGGSRRLRRPQSHARTTASLRSRMSATAIRPIRPDAKKAASSLQERTAAYNRRNA